MNDLDADDGDDDDDTDLHGADLPRRPEDDGDGVGDEEAGGTVQEKTPTAKDEVRRRQAPHVRTTGRGSEALAQQFERVPA